MKLEFKVDLKHQLKSSKETWIILCYFIAFPIIISLIRNQNPINMTLTMILFWFILNVLLLLPIHIYYLLKNWNTKLIIFPDSNKIEIVENNIKYEFDLDKIYTERVIAAFHRDGFITGIVPFLYYGFVRINTQSKSFLITSLMANPFDFPIPINRTKYGYTTARRYFTNEEIKQRQSESENLKENRVKFFIESFKDLDSEELKYKLETSELFCEEALTAAKRILDSRNT